ncbi:aldo/keto reductase family protein [Aspergillus affinis]|uniref:aldo/keto reductase family protein n=1 Tax=Aspergillus affinis TaxID=1070780 RepID=UPI0022FDBA44|nr:Aldo/keto reductase [Aspergillus affinis]KAI9035724.1 Aldo/keto reductase [Aspergillus affinis]
MSLGRTFKLNTGYEIPAVGLGTWQSKPNEVKQAVAAALKGGYRHIDAASVYGNEREVGDGLKASGVPREEIFLTSKLWNTDHDPENVEAAVDRSLSDLQTDYLDLYLIHWPVAFHHSLTTVQPVDEKTGLIDVIDVPIQDTWTAMEALVAKGKVRSIGVSNFTKEKIEELLKTKDPTCCESNRSPSLPPAKGLVGMGIVVTGYSPLGNNIYNIPRAVDDPRVIETAKSLGKTPAQVLVSWAVQRGTVVLPKSVTPERIQSNFEDFILPEDAFQAVQSLERHQRLNFPARLGVDIFGEVGEESVKKSALDWAEQQRKLRN